MIYVVNTIKQNTDGTSSRVKLFEEYDLAKKYAEQEVELCQEKFKDADVERVDDDMCYLISLDANTHMVISINSAEICKSL